MPAKNFDEKTVEGFGDEWQSFDQSEQSLDVKTRLDIFERYFQVFPWKSLPPGAEGADFGCGSGRWTALAAPRVGKIHAVDASSAALAVARRNLANLPNVEFHHSDLSTVSLPDGSLDFAFSLGVLHHLPDTQRAIRDIATKLKPGAPFLVYLYYAMDNRPAWFRGLWTLTNYMRRVISVLPHKLKLVSTTVLAAILYWP